MEFAVSDEEARFRASIRDWLKENLPAGWGTPDFKAPETPAERVAFARRWQRTLFEGGWAGLSWPREYGGRNLTPLEHVMYLEEYVRAEAPDMIHIGIGPSLTGPTLIHHGTEWQKKRFLEPILSGEEVWCQGFSEPGSGSDLASLRTRAEIDGDDLVINGQKVWTSYAQHADWCILIVRTDASGPKHRGLTFVLLDMRTPGITIRPLVEMTGIAWFNEVFFENVRVPRANVVGEINRGWDITITTLSHERGSVYQHARLGRDFRQAVALARRLDAGKLADARTRQRLAQIATEIEILRLTIYRSVSATQRTGHPGPEGSMCKLFASEVEQRLMEEALSICGPYGMLDEHESQALDEGRWQYRLLWSRAATIYAGTSEVQRNIIAQRVLGLPRG